MTMLQSLLSSIMSSGGQQSTGTAPEERLAKENRAAIRKLYEGASPEERKALLPTLERAGVSTEPYKIMEGIESPEEQANRVLGEQIVQMLGGVAPTAPPAQQPITPSLTQGTSAAPTTQPTEPTRPQQQPQIFSQDMLKRIAIKKYTGIDVGAHYFEAPQWFNSYGERIKNGMPVNQAVNETAIEYGFIPDGASNLEGLDETERTVIFEREFSSAMSDPTLDAVLKRIAPEGVSLDKAKAGLILDAFAQNGRYIPEHYQPLLDRFRNLEDPDFISNEMQTWAYQALGKNPADLEPDDIATIRKMMNDDAVIQAARTAAATTTARTQAEWAQEISKPVSAEDRAKHGIGSEIKSYQEIADAGRRFPTETDRKTYTELYAMRAKMESFHDILFGTKESPQDGIFTGIGDGVGARTAAKGGLARDSIRGTRRGQNKQIYDDLLASMARSLIKLAGETGSRLTDVDVEQIMRSAPDSGQGITGLPDAEKVAQRKFERFLVDLAVRLNTLENETIVKPIGQPEEPTAPEYEIGDRYEFDDGSIREYQGEGKWQTINQNQ